MTSFAPPEVSQLLERFQTKKTTVKIRLNDIVDDLFGDFLSEMTRIAVYCPKCSSPAAVEPVNGGGGTTLHRHPKQSPKSQQHAYIESTIRSAQRRARDMIKDELYDSEPLPRMPPNGALLKHHHALRSASFEAVNPDEPEITLTPIDTLITAAALSMPASNNTDVVDFNGNGHHHPNINNNNNNNHNNGHHQNDDGHTSDEPLSRRQSSTGNEGDYESDQEFECAETAVETEETAVKSENDGEDEEEPRVMPGLADKSLEELNTMCSGLPYAKLGGKYVCQFKGCNQELKSRHNLLLHQRAHLGIRPYRCKWGNCGYNSNQSSAVIRHIRTKHFLLPLTMREQQMKNIEDDRDPKEFLEIVAADPTNTSSAATPESQLADPSSVEPNSDSQQSEASLSLICAEQQQQQQAFKSNGKGKRTPPISSQPQQSLLVPQYTNGKAAVHQQQQHPQALLSASQSQDESDEDEYDSDENDFEMIPMRELQRAQLALKSNAFLKQFQQQQHQQQLNSKSPFDYARKRRLEAKIFASASLSSRSTRSSDGVGGGVGDYYTHGPVKRAKSGGGGAQPYNTPIFVDPSVTPPYSHSKPQHSYSFCPEDDCQGIFRTPLELDRHLTDVHNRMPTSPKSAHTLSPPPSLDGRGSKTPQTYSNLYICRWPKCPFSTVLHSSAINHVRGKHFNIPRTLTAQQRRLFANDTRNPNDYIKLLPFND